jgi:hypothetical protein
LTCSRGTQQDRATPVIRQAANSNSVKWGLCQISQSCTAARDPLLLTTCSQRTVPCDTAGPGHT